jgi:hypothetical protein
VPGQPGNPIDEALHVAPKIPLHRYGGLKPIPLRPMLLRESVLGFYGSEGRD